MGRGFFKHPLFIALPLYALDQATKWWAIQNINFEGPPDEHPVIAGFFYLVYWGNTGSAFSMFRDNNLPFTILSLVTLIGLLVAWARGMFREPLYRWGVGLLMGGILGNLTDRLIHQHVVDFLVFYLHVPGANPWPAFNVADSCICIAVVLFLIASFQEARSQAKQPAPAQK
jgi:signal peptidase II